MAFVTIYPKKPMLDSTTGTAIPAGEPDCDATTSHQQPSQNMAEKRRILALSDLLVSWVVVRFTPTSALTAAPAIGAPQLGQAAALFDTDVAHSGQVISAMMAISVRVCSFMQPRRMTV